MVDILIDDISPRLTYTLDFVFKSRGIEYALEKDMGKFLSSNNSKFNYSARYTEGVEHIEPCTLLFENEIDTPSISKGSYKGVDCLSFDRNTDVLASIFYTISRYEEYTSNLKDKHDRFQFKGSVADRFGWIEQLVAERWCFAICKSIGVSLKNENINIIPTFDIDNAYAYKCKSKKRTLFSILKDVITFNFDRLKERKDVFSFKIIDPFDTFEKIERIGSKFPLTKVFWLNCSNEKFDRNVPILNVKKLVQNLNESTDLGIHPSYSSFLKPDKVKNEIDVLNSITHSNTKKSRQHFLRFTLPESFQLLSEVGITNDFSMGFADSVGFRAGTARTHNWFDLTTNMSTDLKVTPFAYMDGSLLDYMKLDIESSKLKIKKLYEEVQTYGGDFVFLWHNETIGDYGRWKGWSSVLDFTLNLRNE